MQENNSSQLGLVRKVDMLREDLKVEVNKINPQVGDLIIIKPKNNSISFPAQYIQWLGDSLQQFYPNNQIIIMPDNLVSVEVASASGGI